MEWCQKIRKIICKHMAHFRQVLTSFGQDWQREQMVVFRMEMLRRQNLHLFTERCQIQNAYEHATGRAPVFSEPFGSIGSVDCTFTLTPRSEKLYLSVERDELCPDDVTYSSYLGSHGKKLLIVCSHTIAKYDKKLIYLIVIANASVADITLWDFSRDKLNDGMAAGVYWLGDNAFQGCEDTMTPYQGWHHCVMSAISSDLQLKKILTWAF